MSIEDTHGLILRTTPFSETSLIISFFTRDFGKIGGLLKAARKRDRNFSTSFEPFTVNRIVFYRKRSGLHLVTQCDMDERFDEIRTNILKNSYAAYFMEILDGFSAQEHRDEQLYDIAVTSLHFLALDPDPERAARVFEIKMLKCAGLMPELLNCSGCSKKINGTSKFSMRSGGLVCGSCARSEQAARMISGGAISSIKHMASAQLSDCLSSRFGLAKTVKKELKSLFRAFITFHLEREPKTLKFIDKLARAEAGI